MRITLASFELCKVDHVGSKIIRCHQDTEVKSRLVKFLHGSEPSVTKGPYAQRLVKHGNLVEPLAKSYDPGVSQLANLSTRPTRSSQLGRYSISILPGGKFGATK